MLAKLIKYNLKPVIKSLLPFTILLFFSVILFNVTGYETELIFDVQGDRTALIDVIDASELQKFIHGLASFLISCSLILLIATTIKSLWQRFSINFYSDEAYLTHTLPIPHKTLWNAQFINIIIASASVVLIMALGCLLLVLSPSGLQLLDSLGLIGGCAHCVGEYYSVEPLELSFYLLYGFIVFIEIVFLTLCGITGIIIKHRLSKKLALISGVIIYMACSSLLLAIFLLIGQFDKDILGVFGGAPVRVPDLEIDISYMTRAILYIELIYCCYCTALYFVDRKLLKHGINLD